MRNLLSKEEADQIMKTQGQVKGVVFQTDAESVGKKWGREGLLEVEERLKELGYPIEYERAKSLEWYPIGLRTLSLLAIRDAFKLNDEDIKIMGNTAPKFSFIVKLMMKFFLTPKMTIEHSPDFWEKHYSAGKMETAFIEREKRAVVVLKGISLHPAVCKYLEGYFQRIMQYSLGKEVESREVQCVFKGGPHHEYQLTWQ